MGRSMRGAASKHPLPEGWGAPETVADVVTFEGVDVARAGVASTSPEGESITGSAAGTGSEVDARSWYELLERVSLVEASRKRDDVFALRDRGGVYAGLSPGSALFPS